MNSEGKVVYEGVYNSHLRIRTTDFNAGIYFLKVETSEFSFIRNVVIRK